MIGEEIYKKLKEKYNFNSILFCPYKEEMFDSMRTVYETALKDNVECALMPIPYWNLYHTLPVGLNIEFNGINFPDALNRRWDVIVIHYPYDNRNSITRPLIFTSTLKCFCDKLVLLPYACVGDRDVYEHEVLLPYTQVISLQVVETEKQKKQIEEIWKQHGIEGEVEAWGSAKFDERKIEIPQEWKEKSNGRKVILLQTSVVPYLQNANKLDEIENFIDSTDDCILWRPHPLYVQTIKSIRPYELEKYFRIQNKADIIDETKDYQNAFAFCDEMVSDGSSLDILFKSTNKPLKRL